MTRSASGCGRISDARQALSLRPLSVASLDSVVPRFHTALFMSWGCQPFGWSGLAVITDTSVSITFVMRSTQ